MGRALGYLAVAALAVATLAAAQTQDRANNVGTAQATSQSNQFLVPAGGALCTSLLQSGGLLCGAALSCIFFGTAG